jgi:hypothetical protein
MIKDWTIRSQASFIKIGQSWLVLLNKKSYKVGG